MVSPCDNCVHKLVCRYQPQMERLSDKLMKTVFETNDETEKISDIITFFLQCKQYTEPRTSTR